VRATAIAAGVAEAATVEAEDAAIKSETQTDPETDFDPGLLLR
jgi:hypothetical protein